MLSRAGSLGAQLELGVISLKESKGNEYGGQLAFASAFPYTPPLF